MSYVSDADIERMVKEAEQHSDEDRKRRELAEAHNHAEALIHTTESSLNEFGDKASEANRTAVEEAMTALKSVKDGSDLEEIKSKTDALAQASMKLGEGIYKAQQAEQAESGGAQSAGQASGDEPEDNVVDAEFEEVDDDKKSKSA